jgi:hypothetical protein
MMKVARLVLLWVVFTVTGPHWLPARGGYPAPIMDGISNVFDQVLQVRDGVWRSQFWQMNPH